MHHIPILDDNASIIDLDTMASLSVKLTDALFHNHNYESNSIFMDGAISVFLSMLLILSVVDLLIWCLCCNQYLRLQLQLTDRLGLMLWWISVICPDPCPSCINLWGRELYAISICWWYGAGVASGLLRLDYHQRMGSRCVWLLHDSSCFRVAHLVFPFSRGRFPAFQVVLSGRENARVPLTP
jgi:hypothetical protein